MSYEYQQSDHEGLDAGHRSVVRNNAISRDARLLFVILNSFASTEQGCFVSNARLAFYMGCSYNSVQNWIKELKDAGFISVKVEGNNDRLISIVSKLTVSMGKGVPSSVGRGTQPQTGGVPNSVGRGYPPGWVIGNRDEGIDLGNLSPTPLKEGKEVEREKLPLSTTGLPQRLENILRAEGIGTPTLSWLGSNYCFIVQMNKSEAFKLGRTFEDLCRAVVELKEADGDLDLKQVSKEVDDWPKNVLKLPMDTRSQYRKLGLAGWIRNRGWQAYKPATNPAKAQQERMREMHLAVNRRPPENTQSAGPVVENIFGKLMGLE